MTQSFIKSAFTIGMANLGLFLVSLCLFGGEAINGMIKYGHYYLASTNSLKPYVEVTQTIFTISQLICYSAVITGSVGVILMIVFGKK